MPTEAVGSSQGAGNAEADFTDLLLRCVVNPIPSRSTPTTSCHRAQKKPLFLAFFNLHLCHIPTNHRYTDVVSPVRRQQRGREQGSGMHVDPGIQIKIVGGAVSSTERHCYNGANHQAAQSYVCVRSVEAGLLCSVRYAG